LDFRLNPALDFYKSNIDKKFEFDITWIWHESSLGDGWSWNDYDAAYMAERSPFPIYGNVVKFYKNGEIKFPFSDSSRFGFEGIGTFPSYFEKKLEFHL
jgi:D-alanyl-D-alanine carboxypeptidase/D-alanyl-D-alanine-endopeptidase (penicillin-binding protein 4)